MSTSLYNVIVAKKIALLEIKLGEIRSWPLPSCDALAENSMLRNAVERGLQVCVEIVIDVSERLIAIEGRTPAESSYGNLCVLQEIGGVASADKYRTMIQFRNFIVHRYEYVDTEILYDICVNKLGLFDDFILEVKRFITRP